MPQIQIIKNPNSNKQNESRSDYPCHTIEGYSPTAASQDQTIEGKAAPPRPSPYSDLPAQLPSPTPSLTLSPTPSPPPSPTPSSTT